MEIGIGWEDIDSESVPEDAKFISDNSGWEDVDQSSVPEDAKYLTEEVIGDIAQQKPTVTKYEPDVIKNAEMELGDNESIDLDLNSSISQIEEARIKYPYMSETYDLAISNAKMLAQRKKDNLVIEKIARLENEAKLREIEGRSTPLDRTITSAKGVGLGMLKLPVGILRGGEALTDFAGLTDEETTVWKDAGSKIQEKIEKDGLEGEALLGELIASGGALGAVARKIATAGLLKLSAMAGGEAGLITAGEGKGVKDIATNTVVGTAGTLALGIVIKGATKLYFAVKNRKATDMDKMLDKMSPDERRATEEVLDILDESNIKKMDEEARDIILDKIDFSKSSDEVSLALKKEIDNARKTSRDSYNALYDKANKIGDNSKPVETSSISDGLRNRDKKQYTEDENNLIKAILTKVHKANGRKASEVEVILRDIFEIKSNPTPSEKRIIEGVRDDLKARQSVALGDKHSGVYDEARDSWMGHQKQFTGRVEGKEGIGSKLGKIEKAEQVSDIPEDILGLSLNSKAVNGLENLNLSKEVKFDIVKDFISKGVEKDRLNTPEGIRAIVSNINKINPETLGKFVGEAEAKKMLSEMRALATIQDIVNKSGNIKDNLMDDLTKFVVSAGLLKVSPVYGTKGMIESTKRIFKDTEILPKDILIKRAKTIKDNATRNRVMSLIHRVDTKKDLP